MVPRLPRLVRPVLVVVMLVMGLMVVQQAQPSVAQLDSRYFPETAFRVDTDAFWDTYDKIGRQRGIGLPISRTFKLLGRPTQLFQRGMLQLSHDGQVYIVGMLQDDLLFPYGSINGSIFPTYDINLVSQAPIAGTEGYDLAIIAYLRQNVPNEVDGQPVKFMETYVNPIRESDDDLSILANLPIWGIATSAATRDPANPRVIYQRFERGMMVYESGCRCTRVLPVGELFKGVLTGQNLPLDFESQAPNSPFLRQYDVELNVGPFRKDQLPDTDLTNAFLPSAIEPVSWATVQEVVPAPPDPFAYELAPTSTPVFQPPTVTPSPTRTPRSTATSQSTPASR